LGEHCTEESEKQTLLDLASRQGSEKYDSSIRGPALSILDILLTYPSCKIPAVALIEHLGRLIPRAYSISSSPLRDSKSFTIAFNLTKISKENGRQYSRLGVCTGWLYEQAIKNKLLPIGENEKNLDPDNLAMRFSEMNLKHSFPEVVVYRRRNHNFRLPVPEKMHVPIIMVGPGTGVAPFVGKAVKNKKQ